MALSQAESQSNWKDTIFKVLVGIVISNAGWFTIWTQDVATKEWVRENPPILARLPALATRMQQVSDLESKVTWLEKNEVATNGTLTHLSETTKDLNIVIKELTREVASLKIELAHKR